MGKQEEPAAEPDRRCSESKAVSQRTAHTPASVLPLAGRARQAERLVRFGPERGCNPTELAYSKLRRYTPGPRRGHREVQ